MTLLEKMKSWVGSRKTGKVFCRYSHYLRKYIAFQVVKEFGESPYPENIGLLFLDWLGDAFIQKEDLTEVRAWGKIIFTNKPVPRGFLHVFDAPVYKPEKTRGVGCSYLPWYNWDAAFAYKKLFGHLPDERRRKDRKVNKQNGRLDLRGAETTVNVSKSQIDELIIDEAVRTLSIDAATSIGRIIDDGLGKNLRLLLSSKQISFTGLDNLTYLSVENMSEINLHDIVSSYPALRDLSIFGKAGKVTGFDALKQLPNLEVLFCVDACGFDGSDMPSPEELPNLFFLRMDGLPVETAKRIRKLWMHTEGAIVEIARPYKPEWFLENQNNPFRFWMERDEIPKRAITKAVATYRTLEKQTNSLSSVPKDKRQYCFSDAVRSFVVALTKVDKQYKFIETMEREEIYDAGVNLLNLAREQYGLVMTDEEFMAVFDENRDW